MNTPFCIVCQNVNRNPGSTCERCGALLVEREQQIQQLMAEVAKGNNRAKSILGSAYLFGDGVPVDLSSAETLLLEAARTGDTVASFHLGIMYSEVMKPKTEDLEARATHWFLQCYNATTIMLPITEILGDRFRWGVGVQEDLSRAAEFYLKGAKANSADCQYKLAMLLNRTNRYIESNYWLQIAAENGLIQAQYNLGQQRLFCENEFRNQMIGLAWLEQAVLQNHEDATSLLRQLATDDSNPELAAEAAGILQRGIAAGAS